MAYASALGNGRIWQLTFAVVFFGGLWRVFIFTQGGKPRMPKPVRLGPFEELDLRPNFGSHCSFHRLGVEFAVETGGMCLAIRRRAIGIREPNNYFI